MFFLEKKEKEKRVKVHLLELRHHKTPQDLQYEIPTHFALC